MSIRGDDMNSVIYNPLEEFDTKYRELHSNHTHQFFDSLVQQSGIDIEQNRQTVKQYNQYKENLAALKKKVNWFRFWRVLMCITILLIPLVIKKITPGIRALRAEMDAADQKADELMKEAYNQMLPLNTLFTDTDALNIIEKTIPLLSFAECFSVKQEADMRINYDFQGHSIFSRESTQLYLIPGYLS